MDAIRCSGGGLVGAAAAAPTGAGTVVVGTRDTSAVAFMGAEEPR